MEEWMRRGWTAASILLATCNAVAHGMGWMDLVALIQELSPPP